MSKQPKSAFLQGIHDGLPIGIGYLAVSFAVGISAYQAGIHILQAAVMSLFNLTAAGEASAISLIAAGTTVGEMAMTQLVINIRYLLMSCALSQKLSPQTPLRHRFAVSFGVTDEIFAISASYPGPLPPAYNYGAMAVAVPGWTLGTLLGAWLGDILPAFLVTALGVCLYGMFVAVVIPASKKNLPVAWTALGAMVLNTAITYLPFTAHISEGCRIITVTLAVSVAAALLAPVQDEEEAEQHA